MVIKVVPLLTAVILHVVMQSHERVNAPMLLNVLRSLVACCPTPTTLKSRRLSR